MVSVMEETLELYEVTYQDLQKLSLEKKPPLLDEEVRRLESISNEMMHHLGRGGSGLLSVSGVAEAGTLPKTLLPLARKLAILDRDDRKRVLKDHNLGSDVPLKNANRTVSSFAMQMKYGQGFDLKAGGVDEGEFKDLGSTFQELGFCMMELGLSIARVCDKFIGGRELQQSLLQCGSAKGRLIHYHSIADNAAAIKEASTQKQHSRSKDYKSAEVEQSDLWQQWHYDYGVFTVLTSPMFLLSMGVKSHECESPNGHTSLQVFHPELKRAMMVKAAKGNFIVQVGEAAEVFSKGKLHASLHSVQRPLKLGDNLSRETFVVFLQPSWNKTFSLQNYPLEQSEEHVSDHNEMNTIVHKVIPLCVHD